MSTPLAAAVDVLDERQSKDMLSIVELHVAQLQVAVAPVDPREAGEETDEAEDQRPCDRDADLAAQPCSERGERDDDHERG